MPTWIKTPLAILADDAGGGIVVDGSRIVGTCASWQDTGHCM